MKYHIATRTRNKLLSYALCNTLEEAKEQIGRYKHIWRVGIYQQDKLGYLKKIK